MKTYAEKKEQARNKAVEWQKSLDAHSYSYGEMAYFLGYFERLGKRYGLLEEFRENGII